MVEPKAFVVVGEDGVPHLLALEGGKHGVVRRGVEILSGKLDTVALGGADAPRLGSGDDE